MDSQLANLREKLQAQQVVVSRLGLDVERPLKSIDAGFPENAVTLVGKLIERVLKECWAHFDVIGKPEGKGLNDLIKGVKEHISSPGVLQALADIQQLRNRSAHDGYILGEEDALLSLARLAVVLEWLRTTRHDLTGEANVLPGEELRARIEFVSGLYDALGYRLQLRQDLTSATTYLQFGNQSGSHADYVEIVLGQSYLELCQIFESMHGELLRTGYPKITRFVLVDDEHEQQPDSPFGPARIVGYQQFLDTIINSRVLADIASQRAALRQYDGRTESLRLAGDLLTIDRRTLQYSIKRVPDVEALVRRQEAGRGNLLIIGAGGMGKSETLLRLAVAPAVGGRYRFYLDLGDRMLNESFPELVVRQLGDAFDVPRLQVWDCFLYLVRSGRCVCLLDAVDEGVIGGEVDEIVRLFGELSVLLSQSSATVLTSRQSFLLDSPYVRQLLHKDALVSEKISGRLVSEGVDVLSLPDFACIRLTGVAERPGVSPLMTQLAARASDQDGESLPPLVHQFLHLACEAAGTTPAALADAAGADCLRGESVVSVFDLFRHLGPGVFSDGHPEADHCLLRDVLVPVSRGELRFRHQVFREYLAAHYYMTHPEDSAIAGFAVTDQCREFVRHLSAILVLGLAGEVGQGTHLVGPPGKLHVHYQEMPVPIEQYLVTASDYALFLRAAEDGAVTQHPLQPNGASVLPFYDRLQIPDLYTNPRYGDYPATCVSWWGAWAYASWRGSRLPTSTEWELAARGRDGRLFPWGDEADFSRLNCADHWSSRLFPSWDEWRSAYDRGELAAGEPTPVGTFADHASPSGCQDMAGNVWEWTATCLTSAGDAVIAGGSFDNPIRGTRTFSRGTYRLNGRSNAVGFRIVRSAERAE